MRELIILIIAHERIRALAGENYFTGHIEFDIYQFTYQHYYLRNITDKHFNNLKRSWDWTPNRMSYLNYNTWEIKQDNNANNNNNYSFISRFISYSI